MFKNRLPFIFSIVSLVVVWGCQYFGIGTYKAFVVCFFLTLWINLPKKAISPLTLFFAYYGAWYIVAPIGAVSYGKGRLFQPEYTLAICYVYSVFTLGVMSIKYGETFEFPSFFVPDNKKEKIERIFANFPQYIVGLFIFATLMVIAIISVSGGFEHWWQNPGMAFLNRAGSGAFVILSHFSALILALMCGYYTFRTSKKWPIALFMLWLLATSPVHGSKFMISVFVVVLFTPWLRNIKLISVKSLLLYVTFVLVFFLGMHFRNFPFSMMLNYFTALENLARSLMDFQPSFLTTFFLPFVKFKTPFGLTDPKMYYDMNHMLTDLYYPDAWRIRATEQWPVETDMYLNFHFHFGLPLICLYLGFIGYLYKKAESINSLGHWFASMMMTLLIISHLRGSLINHTDFYMYPFIFLTCYMFRNFSLNTQNEN